MKSYPVERARHLILRADRGEVIPDALNRALSDQAVACGFLRATGVLVDVDLRAYDGETGTFGASRRITGPVHALSIEASIGLDRGEPSVSLRAVLARETDRGMEVLAGEIVAARVVGFEAHVTSYDDLALGRVVDDESGVALLTDPSAPAAPPRAEPERPAAPAAGAFSAAIAASAEADARPAVRGGAVGGAIPPRPVRPQRVHDEALVPEANDVVEHFAFGRCDVIKSEGDRLFLKVNKEGGRIKEIALEMLKVTPLPSDGPNRHFKLERKL